MPREVDETVFAIVGSTPVILRELFLRLPPHARDAELDDGWPAKHCLAHVLDTEEVIVGRMRRIVAEERPFIPSIDSRARLQAGGAEVTIIDSYSSGVIYTSHEGDSVTLDGFTVLGNEAAESMMVVRGARVGHQNRRPAGVGQLRHGGGAGTGNDQLRPGQACRQIVEEGAKLMIDAAGLIGLGHASQLVAGDLLDQL